MWTAEAICGLVLAARAAGGGGSRALNITTALLFISGSRVEQKGCGKHFARLLLHNLFSVLPSSLSCYY